MTKKKGWEVRKISTVSIHPVLGEHKVSIEMHVIPLRDLKEHEATDECWCKPDIILEPELLPRYVHNSLDKRELKEKGNKLAPLNIC